MKIAKIEINFHSKELDIDITDFKHSNLWLDLSSRSKAAKVYKTLCNNFKKDLIREIKSCEG